MKKVILKAFPTLIIVLLISSITTSSVFAYEIKKHKVDKVYYQTTGILTDSFPLVISVDKNAPAMLTEAVQYGINTWNNAMRTPIFFYGGNNTASDKISHDGINFVSFLDDYSFLFNPEVKPDSIHLGATTSFYDSNHHILESDIVIHSNQAYFLNDPPYPGYAYDLKGVVVHELGHALGLGHTESLDSVMMNSMWQNSKSFRQLKKDDYDGLRALYGNLVEPFVPDDQVNTNPDDSNPENPPENPETPGGSEWAPPPEL